MNAWTHLERLERLRDRIEVEIRAEKQRLGRVDIARERMRSVPVAPVQERLRAAGICSRDVKAWARSVGLIEEMKRGRLAPELLDAYLAAHPRRRPIKGSVE